MLSTTIDVHELPARFVELVPSQRQAVMSSSRKAPSRVPGWWRSLPQAGGGPASIPVPSR